MTTIECPICDGFHSNTSHCPFCGAVLYGKDWYIDVATGQKLVRGIPKTRAILHHDPVETIRINLARSYRGE